MRLWRCKWGLLRLAVAAFLLYAVASDTGARLARLQYAALPDFDHAAEIRFLRESGRYGEALAVADAALIDAPAEARPAIEQERLQARTQQQSVLRRLKDVGMGALSGRGTSLESLIGAIGADFFIVGDIRDLVIQGGRYVIDGETDELILILSGVGLATTLAPEIDWVPAILKVARKTGSLTKGLGEFIVRAARAGDTRSLHALLADVRKLAARASPGGAARLLRHADTPEDVATIARFAEAYPSGALALHITGREGAAILKTSARSTRAAAGAALDAEKAVLMAARKGPSGVAWLRAGGHRALMRPHWIAGIGKALYKGNAEDFARRIADLLDPRARWLIPALAAWLFVEIALIARRFLPRPPPIGQPRTA